MFNKYLFFTGIHNNITMFTLHSLGILYTDTVEDFYADFKKLCIKTFTCLTIFT